MGLKEKFIAWLIAGAMIFGAPLAGPTITAQTGVQVTDTAEAASWIPSPRYTGKAPGWGTTCATVRNIKNGRYQSTTQYRWYTSLGYSSCYAYRTYR